MRCPGQSVQPVTSAVPPTPAISRARWPPAAGAGHRRVQFRRGAPAGVPVELLRDLVILTARLAGRRWLEANPDSVAVFTALYLTRMPPLLASSARSLLAFCRAGSARRQRPQRPEQADLRVEVDSDA